MDREHALCHSSCYPADPHLQKMQVVLGHVGERAIKLVNEVSDPPQSSFFNVPDLAPRETILQSMGYHQAQDFSSKISTIFTKDFLAGKSEALDIRNLIQTGNGLRSTSKDMAVVGFNAVLVRSRLDACSRRRSTD